MLSFLPGVLALLAAHPLSAATFNIANGDVYGVNGLVNVLTTCNSNGQDDTINLAANGSYVLTGLNNSTHGPSGTPVLVQDGSGATFRRITINANGATIMRSAAAGTPDFRLFTDHTLAPVESFALTINRAILKNGNASDSLGGAILVNGHLVLNDCTLEDNAARRGGAVAAQARSIRLNRCTLANNDADEVGGGVYNDSADAYLWSCTLAANQSGGAGDGVLTIGQTTGAFTEIFNCTLSGNEIANFELPFIAEVSVGDTIFSNSPIFTQPGASSFSQVVSYGYNLSTDNGNGRLTATADQINTNPQLDPGGLSFNGGPTRTFALTNGSPAIDQGHSSSVPTDQRGAARIVDHAAIANASGGDGSDIGAYEAPADPLQSGTSFVVTTTDDHNDGICGVSDCSLREALQRTNSLAGANQITFLPGLSGVITLQTALGGPLLLQDNTTIIGPGARLLAISANTQGRVLEVIGGIHSIRGVTLRDGFRAGGAVGASNEGGGIHNGGGLSLTDCTIGNNRVLGVSAGVGSGGHGGDARGGGIYNTGSLGLQGCTFARTTSGNGAFAGHGAQAPDDPEVLETGGRGGAGLGGAIYNAASGNVSIANCTFQGNSTAGGSGGAGYFSGAGGAAEGGAIYNLGTIIISSSTISGNHGGGGTAGPGFFPTNGRGVGGVRAAGGQTGIQNTLSAANTRSGGGGSADADGAFTSSGFNLIGVGDLANGFDGPSDQRGTFAAPIDAKLGPLQNNGGGTDTMALLTGSPALDQGKAFSLTTDQRGQTRPNDNPLINNAEDGDGSDIGAFEVGGFLVVTTIADGDDGACNPSHCTLREAINAANAQSGDAIISFLPAVTGTIQLASALPTLSNNMTVQGPGPDLLAVRRDTGGDYRIFTVGDDFHTGLNVTLSGLTITNGRISSGVFPAHSGAGISSRHGTLTLIKCRVTDNHTVVAGGLGGGLLNANGTATLIKCTMSGNSSMAGAGIMNTSGGTLVVQSSTMSGNTASGKGGGVMNVGGGSSNGTSTLTNCTLSGNNATAGGAVENHAAFGATASVTLTNCTLAGNNASNGGGIHNFSDPANPGAPTATLRNAIFKTGTTGANVVNEGSGAINSGGHNLSSDNGGGFLTAMGDQIDTDPGLLALAHNGGPTQTHALASTSPAIDAGNDPFAPVNDQRGYFRVGTSDIGAFEFNGIELRITAITRLTNGHIFVQGTGAPNQVHTMQAADNPNAASFTPLPPAVAADTNGLWQFTDSAPPPVMRFYHLTLP